MTKRKIRNIVLSYVGLTFIIGVCFLQSEYPEKFGGIFRYIIYSLTVLSLLALPWFYGLMLTSDNRDWDDPERKKDEGRDK